MKTKKSDLVAKIFLAAVIVILVGLLIAWMMGVFKDKKQDLNSGTEKIDGTLSSVADFDLLVYDGDTIRGETLVDLIEEVCDKKLELSIAVKTLVNAEKSAPVTIYYNKVLTTKKEINEETPSSLNQKDKSIDSYITPSANFKGEVLKNKNNEITGILFTQQK